VTEQATLPIPRPGAGRRDQTSPFLFLALEAGRPSAGSARFLLDDLDVVEIGRGSERRARRTVEDGVRRLRVQAPDPWMSQVHARIQRRGGTCTLADAGSRNGTRLNGAPVTSATLEDGDVVELGQTFFRYRAGLPDPSRGADIIDAAEAPAGLATVLPVFQHRLDELARVAPSAVAVALRGPSGSGKEVIARAIHAQSGRTGPFIAVNCGAIPHNLVESELFGHRRGAFSGAAADRVGLVAAADGGTLFLDEIGDLPLSVQPSLLRVLQERAVVPVGATQPVAVDFRLLSATHRDLPAMIAAGAFREDLWGRLAGYELEVPPLAERREDLATLVADLLDRLAPDREVAVSADAARALLRYRWPRNVRELEKALETALALAGRGDLDLEHLPAIITDGVPRSGRFELEVPRQRPPTPPPVGGSPDPRRDGLVASLREHHGNVSAVARSLGKPRSQIQRWMRRWDLRASDFA
jgi:DNA-binding NtrC family response regulator